MNVQRNTALVTLVAVAYLVVIIIIIAVRATLFANSSQILRIAGLTFMGEGALYQVVVKALRTNKEIEESSVTTLGHLPLGGVWKKERDVAQGAMVLILIGFTLQLFGTI